MSRFELKRAGIKSKYKYVRSYIHPRNGQVFYCAELRNFGVAKYKTFMDDPEGERNAAKLVDMWLIQIGRDPVNVLKKK